MVYSTQDINKIRKAGRVCRYIKNRLLNTDMEGMTTNEINDLCESLMREKNAEPAALGYKGFPKAVCISVNNEVCHGIPSDRVIENGDVFTVDFAVKKNGFYADCAVPFYTTQEGGNFCKVVSSCVTAGVKEVRPGNFIGATGKAIEECLLAQEYPYKSVKDYCGHGVGRHFHEPPQILHFDCPESEDYYTPMVPGMVFTIEPMINSGSDGVVLGEDGWTVLTKDGSKSLQEEVTVLVTRDGHEVLT